MSFNEFLKQTFHVGPYGISVIEIVEIALVIVVAKILLHVLRRGLRRVHRRQAIDEGKRFIIGRIFTTIAWTLALLIILSILGINLTALWAGSAALLVGVGIGLQGFFNDVISGFVLLFEGGVSVGNVLEVDGKLVRVERIDLRSTRAVSVAGELIVLPNAKVAGEAVVNLSQGERAMRIRVNVGVAYGSDLELVTRLLAEAMAEQPEVLKSPEPAVFFQEFGDSSLNFSVMGWLDDPWDRMGIQSRVRRAIDLKFRENNVTIPFPQRDVHVRTMPSTDSTGT